MLSQSLTTWDAKVNPKAPLSDKQNDSFIELSIKCQWTKRPLPNNILRSSSIESTTSSTSQRIENAEQFFTWLSEIEEKIEEDTDYQHRSYVRQLRSYTAECTRLHDEMESAKRDLEGLSIKYAGVSSKTSQLHDACEKLLSEQTQLANDAECICTKLSFFTELDRVTSKLNSNKISVTSESFMPLLNRIDECMAYLKANPQYSESTAYLAQFRSCLHRALSLVRVHVSDILCKATQQVMPHKNILAKAVGFEKDESIQIEDAFTLFYGKFQINAPRVKSILDDINQRTEKCQEYEHLLNDCYACYFTQRKTILTPSIAKAIKDLELKYTKDYCSLMRSGNSFLIHICEDEYALFMHFFSRPTPLLDYMLADFCQMMYDLFRPLLIHISHLETLSELCSIITIEMLQEHVQNNAVQLKAFGDVCEQVLSDIQERLVYRTYIYIRNEIGGYKPSPGDIAYPEKLEMMQSISESISKENNPEITASPFFDKNSERPTHQSISPADLHGMWYPTVRRTLMCLSKLYRCLNKSTFQGLSQETLSMATMSLIKASELISERKTKLDGALFLIKHLLIIREQIAPFQVSFSIKETALDFSRIKEAAKDLFSARSKMFSLTSNNAVLQFLLDGTPQPMETLVDSKREVDMQLKTNCEQFIRFVIQDLVGSIEAFLGKASLIVEMNAEDASRRVLLSDQPFASVETVAALVSEAYRRVSRKQLAVRSTMHLYLANNDTEFILFKPIKTGVTATFGKLIKLLAEHYNEDDREIIACPSLEQVNLLISAPRRSSTKTIIQTSSSSSNQYSVKPSISTPSDSLTSSTSDSLTSSPSDTLTPATSEPLTSTISGTPTSSTSDTMRSITTTNDDLDTSVSLEPCVSSTLTSDIAAPEPLPLSLTIPLPISLASNLQSFTNPEDSKLTEI